MFKNFGKELGEDIREGAKIIKVTGKDLGSKLEKVGNVEKAAKIFKEGLVISSGIIVGGIILNTIIKKL